MSYHFHLAPIQRSKGDSVVDKAAYHAREKFREERTGEYTKDYSQDHAPPVAALLFVDKNAPANFRTVEGLANAMDKVEKYKNAQTGLAFVAALPHLLTDEQRRQLVRDFGREDFTRKGYAGMAHIHAPEHGDDRNWHVHFIRSLRTVSAEGFAATKDRQWDEWGEYLDHCREKWAGLCARYLENAGHRQEADRWRYGHLSNEEQRDKALERGDHEWAKKKDREGTKHLGPKGAALEAQGIQTDIGNHNREVEANAAAREQLPELKQELREMEWSIEYEAQREMQWQDRIASAAIDREKAEQRFLEPQQREKQEAQTGGREKDNREQQPATPAHENIFKRINQSSLTSENAKAFAAALDEHGIAFAVATPEEAYRSERQAQFSKAAHHIPAPVLTAGEIVAVTGPSVEYRREGEIIEPRRVHQLDQTHAESYLELLKTDRSKLQGVDATRQRLDDRAMQRAADWEATRLERATAIDARAPEIPARRPATPFKDVATVIASIAHGIFGAVANVLFPIPAPLTPKQQEAKAERETIDLTDWLEQAERRRHDEARHRQQQDEQEHQRQRERERER